MSTGGVYAIGPCILCGGQFAYNPDRVPSIHLHVVDGQIVSDVDAPRHPICRDCVVNVVNPVRVEAGNDPVLIYDDSYSYIDPAAM